MFKYPRTRHIKGSRFQNGDHDLEAVPVTELIGKPLIVEEKMDGANTGISFEDGKLMLQSRGHFLRGGPREKHFDLLKVWAASKALVLRDIVGDRYVMYGEWLWAKHTMFYDALPHYFMEFDILDKETGVFLSTDRRNELITKAKGRASIVSVDVIGLGSMDSVDGFKGMIGESAFKSRDWERTLEIAAQAAGLSPEDVAKHTDMSPLMEGLYIKWEEDGEVKGRYKFVRESFTNAILEQDEHWLNRPIVCNVLKDGAYERMFA